MDTLIERYQLRAVRAAYLIVGERPLAEDIVQDAFVQLVPIFQRFDESRPFAPWFFGCVPHDALKAVQRQKRLVSLDEAESVEAVELLTALSDSQPGPEALALQAETRWEVWRGSGMSECLIPEHSAPSLCSAPTRATASTQPEPSNGCRTLNPLAEGGVPDDLVLRVAIYHHLETSKVQIDNGVNSLKVSFARPQRILALVTILVLLAFTILLSLQGRTWAQELFQFFTPADRDSFLIPTEQLFTDYPTSTPVPIFILDIEIV